MQREHIKSEITYLFAVIAIITSYLFASISNNAIIVLSIVFIGYLCKYIKTNHLFITLDKGYILLMFFCIFCFISSSWAVQPVYAYKAAFSYGTCIMIAIFLSEIFKSGRSAFHALYTTGVVVGILTVVLYGPSLIIKSILGVSRIENTFCNVNLLGILFAYTILIAFYQMLHKKSGIYIPVMLAELALILSTQSRKALIVVVIGMIGIYFLYTQKKISVVSIIRLLIITGIAILLLIFLSKFSAFNAFKERFEGLYAMFTGVGKLDGSSMLRKQYMEISMEQFRQHPVLGIGMDNARTAIIQSTYRHNTYTHCNYAEMLCDGGVTGIILYYSFHCYLIYCFIRKRENWTVYSRLCLGFLILILILDYGMVSYTEKTNWICMVPVIVESWHLKRKQ